MGNKVGVILFEEKAFIEAAHDFFARLRDLDREDVDLILDKNSPFESSGEKHVIYALYDTEDKYIDAAIVLASPTMTTARAMPML